jgi:cell division protein FtsW (lipid II flippase)
MPPLRFIAPLLLIWGMAMLLFVVARDLGSALLFFGIAVFMTYMATGSKSYVAVAMLFFSAASAVSYMLFSHVRVRVAIWLHPWQDPSGMAYQIVQSLFAIGTGSIWGVGYAHGNPDIIPAVHTDFVFSAIAEELGFLGMTAVLLGYLYLFYHSIRTALSQTRLVYTLIAAGCGTAFMLQAFIIAAGVTKFLPLTGITLPFISYGGSSMIASYLMLALLTILEKEGNERVG